VRCFPGWWQIGAPHDLAQESNFRSAVGTFGRVAPTWWHARTCPGALIFLLPVADKTCNLFGGFVSLTDHYGRRINYLRISVTDRCNLRCRYCMPPEGVPARNHADILRYEEIERVVRAAAGLGISKIRLTGGEPLVRRGIVDLVRMLAQVPGIDDLAMTTNGTLLSRFASDLAQAGLKRVNVSLDTLDEKNYARITRGGQLGDVLEGIESAQEAGLVPLKINTVVLHGLDEDQVCDLASLTLRHDWHVRFIEVMPLHYNATHFDADYMSNEKVRAQIVRRLGPLAPADSVVGNGPARYYRLPGGLGTVGFISAISEHFCSRCNRLRLTADGKIRPCLLSDKEINIKPVLRSGAGLAEIQKWIIKAIMAKPAGHQLRRSIFPHGRGMSEIGG